MDRRLANTHLLNIHAHHLLGTDKVGSDVFYRALKGIRTGLIIGGLTTLNCCNLLRYFSALLLLLRRLDR